MTTSSASRGPPPLQPLDPAGQRVARARRVPAWARTGTQRLVVGGELGEQRRDPLARERLRVGEAAGEGDQVGHAEHRQHRRDPLADVAARARREERVPPPLFRRRCHGFIVKCGVFNVPAEFYDRFVGRYSASLGDELIAFAGIEPGMRVLDVGCGPGGLTRRLVDLGCTVTGCDPSATFAAAAAERVPEAEVVPASAEDLPFADASFDAVLAQLVVNFMADPETGAGEMARVTRPGGTVAACVWDYGGEMTLLRTFWDAACEVEPERGAARERGRDDALRQG